MGRSRKASQSVDPADQNTGVGDGKTKSVKPNPGAETEGRASKAPLSKSVPGKGQAARKLPASAKGNSGNQLGLPRVRRPSDNVDLQKAPSNTQRMASATHISGLPSGGGGPLGPDRSGRQGVDPRDDAFYVGLARQLTNYIYGETPSERLQRGHTAAASRAEADLVRAMDKNRKLEQQVAQSVVEGIPFNYSVNIPHSKLTMSLKKRRKEGGGQMTVLNLKGTDWLSDVVLHTTDDQGAILVDNLIHPRAFPGTRMAAFSELFDKYVFRTFKVKYSPSAATDEEGEMIGFCDYDPDQDMITELSSNVRKAASHLGMSLTQLFKPDQWMLKELKKDMLFFCEPSEGEDRLTYQGRFMLLNASAAPGATTDGGVLTIDYDVDFYIAQLTDTSPMTTNDAFGLTAVTGCTALLPFGSAPVIAPYSNIDISVGSENYGGNVISRLLLPSAAVDVQWVGILYAEGTGIANQLFVFDQDGVNGAIVNDVVLAAGTKRMTEFQFTQQRIQTGSNFQKLFVQLQTATTVTQCHLHLIPLPTAVFLRHNNTSDISEKLDMLEKKLEALESGKPFTEKPIVHVPYQRVIRVCDDSLRFGNNREPKEAKVEEITEKAVTSQCQTPTQNPVPRIYSPALKRS